MENAHAETFSKRIPLAAVSRRIRDIIPVFSNSGDLVLVGTLVIGNRNRSLFVSINFSGITTGDKTARSRFNLGGSTGDRNNALFLGDRFYLEYD